MRRPPRDPHARFLDREQFLFIGWQGLWLALLTLLAFMWSLHGTGDVDHARTVAFTVLIGAQLANAFNCRSNRHSLFALGLTTNMPLLITVAVSFIVQGAILAIPWGRHVFKVTPLDASELLPILMLSLLPIAAMELWKLVIRRNVLTGLLAGGRSQA